jgi:cytochrome c-type biogenesis protein CcmE
MSGRRGCSPAGPYWAVGTLAGSTWIDLIDLPSLDSLPRWRVKLEGGEPPSGKYMSSQAKTYLKFGGATAVILLLLAYLAYTGVQDSKSYYVTIKELHKMGDTAFTKRLRVAGNVQPGSIKRTGTHVQFVLVEEDQTVSVDYTGTEAPPDTFKDDSQALADGSFGRDGVFHAKQLQAKCASKYAPQPGAPGATPVPAKSVT